MPSAKKNKKKPTAVKKKQVKATAEESKQLLEGTKVALQTLDVSLQRDLNTTSNSSLGHWRRVPASVQTGYDMMKGGAQLVHGTSTKFTLVAKIDLVEGAKLAPDLLKGCQHVGTGALVLCAVESGTSISLKHSVQHAARAIVRTCIQLVDSILELGQQQQQQQQQISGGGVAPAPRTGAVWSACDVILENKLPQGNRSAMRRDLLTWKSECNETIQEFQQILTDNPQGQGINDDDDDSNEDDDIGWDGFLQGQGEGYNVHEVLVVEASLAIIKCSRGAINITIKACECVGALAEEQNSNNDDNDSNHDRTSRLQWIGDLHDMARKVGDGMTDVGTTLYSPLNYSDVKEQVKGQTDKIVELCSFVLEFESNNNNNNNNDDDVLDAEIQELATTVKTMVQTRSQQVDESIVEATTSSSPASVP